MKIADALTGRRGLILGVANDRSIAWGIAQSVAESGARLGLTYQGERLQSRVAPLVSSVDSADCARCDPSWLRL